MDSNRRTFKVQTLTKQLFTFDLNTETKVSDIKALLYEKTAVPVERQRLVFNAQLLKDDDAIGLHLKENDHTIFLMARTNEAQEQGYNAEGERSNGGTGARTTKIGGDKYPSAYSPGFQNNPQGDNSNHFNRNLRQPNSSQTSLPGQFPFSSQSPFTGQPPIFTSIIPFTEAYLSFNQLQGLSNIMNQISSGNGLMRPHVPAFQETNSSKRLGQYLSQWHFEMLRMLPYVHRLSELLQKEEYLSPVGRAQTQEQLLNVSTALNASVNATFPLMTECYRVGTTLGNSRFTGYQRQHSYERSRDSAQTGNYPQPQYSEEIDFSNHPFGFTNPEKPIPMRQPSSSRNRNPSLSLTFSDGDPTSIPIKRLVSNYSSANSIWVKLLGDSTIGELFYVFSGDNTSFLENNRLKIASQLDEHSVPKLTEAVTNVFLTEQLRLSHPEGLYSYIFERIEPHVELLVNITKEVSVDYSQHALSEFKTALGEILHELVQLTSISVEKVVESILSSLKRTLGESLFGYGEMYFSLLVPQLRKGLLKAFAEHHKRIEDERNRLII